MQTNRFFKTNFQKKTEIGIVKDINTFTNKEVYVDVTTNFSCKININKTFDYVNHQLSILSGYEAFDLINEPFDKIRHSDMPKIIYTVLNERFAKGLPMLIIEKYLTKNGAYYWLLSKYGPKLNAEGSIISYEVNSIKAPNYSIETIKTLYSNLKKIENKTGDDSMSRRYLIGYLEDLGHTYNSFIDKIVFTEPNDFQKERIKEEIVKSNRATHSKQKNSSRSKVSKKDLINSIQRAIKRGA